MRCTFFSLVIGMTLCGGLAAQSNKVSGLDGRLYNIDDPHYWGRRGAAHPNGELGMSPQNDMCNPGTVTIPWHAVPQENHPKFGFMVVRESNGRMVQISDRSFCKHAFVSTNGAGGTCRPCTN